MRYHDEFAMSKMLQICIMHVMTLTPEDKDTILQKSKRIHRYKYGRVNYEEEYIGESVRTFGERYKNHLQAHSPIFKHYNTIGHTTSVENFSILLREDQNVARSIRDTIFIRVSDPSPNRNMGKYYLPYIWDEVLVNTPELKIK